MFSRLRTENRGCVYMYIVASIFVEVLELRLPGNQKQ